MPRPSNTAERRAQIVKGLRRVMAQRGYDGASTAEIAGAAGLTPGLIHYHFATKREILLALVDELGRDACARGEGALAGTGDDPVGRLEAYLQAFLSDADPERDREDAACWMAIMAEAIRDARVRKAVGAVLAKQAGVLESLVVAAFPAGVATDAVRAKAVAMGLLATMHGYLLLFGVAPDEIPKGSLALVTRRLARVLIDSMTY